jgi:predicted regulator of Ras-like GTPase activity (Roadblock/LC7/MglB family)
VERVISLPLSDFIDQVPADYIKPVEVIDASRKVSLKASEIEKGMPEQNPSVSLASLYQQAPEIFLRTVAPSDATRVPLPFAKVLEQFNSLHVRNDQERVQKVPLFDTPILQATITDTERFGTKLEPLESSELPPLPIETASAEAFASAEPEPVAYGKAKPFKSDSPPSHPVISLRSPKPDAGTEPTSPPGKTPLEFPPNGTGEPASERVPASSGPPVPSLSPPPAAPKRIPFEAPANLKMPEAPAPASKSPAPSKTEPQSSIPTQVPPAVPASNRAPSADSAPAKPQTPASTPAPLKQIPLLLTSGQKDAAAEADAIPEEKETKSDGSTVALALKPILQNVPAFQLNGDANAVAADVRIEFPLEMVKSQLAGGRVTVPATLFKETLPQNYRDLFVIDPGETPVSLPLQEVLKNLPDDALRIRADQETAASTEQIPTPFSKRAEEDEKRFKASVAVPTAVEKSAAEPEASSIKEAAETKEDSEVAPVEKIDGKEVVAQACRIPGVKACEITFLDGLSLAGNFPAGTEAEGLCAMAPMVLQRIDQHMAESKLGALAAMTLHCTNSSVTFFMKGNICLATLHQEQGALAPEARAQLEQLTEKLSHVYTQPETPHVDH